MGRRVAIAGAGIAAFAWGVREPEAPLGGVPVRKMPQNQPATAGPLLDGVQKVNLMDRPAKSRVSIERRSAINSIGAVFTMGEREFTPAEKRYYSVAVVVLYCAAVVLCEFAQWRSGQSFMRGLMDTALLCCALVLLPSYSQCAIYNLTILLWEIVDMISFAWTGDSFSVQFWHALCVQDILTERIQFSVQGLFVLFMCAIMALHPPIFQASSLGIPRRVQAGLLGAVVVLLFGFYGREAGAFDPVGTETVFDSRKFTPGIEKVADYLSQPFSAKFKTDGVKKNVIVIDIPNFETQMIGRYGYRWVFSTPFLSNMTQRVLFAHDVISEPFTLADGSGAMYNALCSMPANKNPGHIAALAAKNNISKMHCLGDFLDLLGYDVVTYKAGKNDYSGLEPVLAKHGLRNVKNFDHDKELFEDLNQTGLKNLSGRQPFVLYISTIDTRPPIFSACDTRGHLYNNEQEYHAVDCIDQYLQGFFAKLAELNLTPHNTQIGVFGDGMRRDLDRRPLRLFTGERRLFAMFPFAPRRFVSQPATLYDFAPTLLELAGIEFSPQFPFGANIVSAPNGVPGKAEYEAIYAGFN
jgi:hypothetical protein